VESPGGDLQQRKAASSLFQCSGFLLTAGKPGGDSVGLSCEYRGRTFAQRRPACRSAALVSAGLELTAYKLTSAAKAAAAPERFVFFFSGSIKRGVSVSFRSESTRIDLNLGSKEMLTNFFGVLGAEPRDAQLYADRVVGWRTPQSADTLESENALYRAAGGRDIFRGALHLRTFRNSGWSCICRRPG